MNASTNPGVAEKLLLADQSYRAGRLEEAMSACAEVLRGDPDNGGALHLAGLVELGRGNFEQATRLLKRAIAVNGGSAVYFCNLGTALRLQQRIEEALESYRAALALDGGYAEAHNNLGAVLHEQGQREEAIRCFERALANAPGYAEAHNNLGTVLQGLGRWGEAIGCYERAVQHKPNYAEAWYNLGLALEREGKRGRAVECLERVVGLKPEFAEAHYRLGNVLRDLSRLPEAIARYQHATALKPTFLEALNSLGIVSARQQNYEQAARAFEQVLSVNENFPDAYNNLGACLQKLGNWDGAVTCFQRAIVAKPDRAELHFFLGNALSAQNKLSDALVSYERAIAIRPTFVEALINLGVRYEILNRLDEAVSCYRRVIAVDPRCQIARSNLGNAYLQEGKTDDAIACFRHALEIDPNYINAHSNLIFALDFSESVGLQEKQAERRRYYERHGRKFADSITPHRNVPDPDRRLRIGYVSPDLGYQSAAYIFSAIILNQDRSRFEVVCYSGVKAGDEVTQAFRSASDLWRSTVGVSDDEMAGQIRKDGIDILVDLSGHNANNRLLVFARKPAPVQVSAWGNATGTGVETIDYLFSDPVAIPADVRHLYAEQVIDLPCAICFQGPGNAPEVSPLPFLERKAFTFGCFNRIGKVSDAVLDPWSRIVRQVPRSRLLIKDIALDNAQARAQLLGRLEARGIESQRVQLLGRTPHAEHLAILNKLDLALDPFPMSGGVSTAEALWMGIPVVTLLGSTPSGRGSASMLTVLGMEEWIAKSEEEYVRIAVALAGKPKALAKIRAELRGRVAACGFGDVVAYTRAVERAYRQMWRRWCADSVRQ